mgnify:CR=1 FL=1
MKSVHSIADYFYTKGNLDSSRFYNTIEINYLKSSHNYKKIFDAFYLRSILLNINNVANEEFEVNTKLIELSEKIGEELYFARSYNRMAWLFLSSGYLKKCIYYSEKSLKILS